MDIEMREDCSGVDWGSVSRLLQSVGMAHYEPEIHRRAFEASHTALFAYHDGGLIGFGRAVSDGVYQAALYDCAVAEAFQGRGVGRLIVGRMLSRLPGCNVILYASPGREGFYRKQGFRKMKTGMALFVHREKMSGKGFTD